MPVILRLTKFSLPWQQNKEVDLDWGGGVKSRVLMYRIKYEDDVFVYSTLVEENGPDGRGGFVTVEIHTILTKRQRKTSPFPLPPLRLELQNCRGGLCSSIYSSS
ncbi:hypothetical protein NE237_027068 [Protea cynaroides]|uniref:Uncharacterized protein n=1 Tax=Protea cynaroides TaxID=273540 RepID=A0A9Q0JSM9_9MAGN|nr:hypothetical protein NE237_027068 [Protea cynaroides]